jgi:hypothetical protein
VKGLGVGTDAKKVKAQLGVIILGLASEFECVDTGQRRKALLEDVDELLHAPEIARLSRRGNKSTDAPEPVFILFVFMTVG